MDDVVVSKGRRVVNENSGGVLFVEKLGNTWVKGVIGNGGRKTT